MAASPAPSASAKTLAIRTGLDIGTVRAACARGLVEPNAAGRYPVEAAERACREHIDHDKVRGNATSGRGNLTAAQVEALGPVDPLEGLYPPEPVDPLEGLYPPGMEPGPAPAANSGTLAALKRDTEQLRNEKARLDLDAKRGKLIDREAVNRLGADVIRRAALHFLDLGRRVAPLVVGMTDPNAIAAVFEREARASLDRLSSLGQLADKVASP